MIERFRCTCDSLMFIRLESVSSESPNPQYFDTVFHVLQCGKCSELWWWNFTTRCWVAQHTVTPDIYLDDYTRTRRQLARSEPS